MFGLGFSEILILGLIAFLIFGPKQFPLIAKECIKLFNDLKQSFSNIKEDISGIETEVQKQIHQVTENINKEWDSVKDLKKETLSTEKRERDQTQNSIKDTESSITKKTREIKKDSF